MAKVYILTYSKRYYQENVAVFSSAKKALEYCKKRIPKFSKGETGYGINEFEIDVIPKGAA